MRVERLSVYVAVGVFLAGIAVVLLAVGGFVPSPFAAAAVFLIVAGIAVFGYWFVYASSGPGPSTGPGRPSVGRRAWTAFCSGWWLAAAVSAVDAFVEAVTRPATGVLEATGVALGMGGISAGGSPVWYAAELAGLGGLPIGFVGILLGFVATVAVWVTFPIVLYADLHGLERAERRRRLIASAIPYVAGAVGLASLHRSYLAEGTSPLRARGRALLAAVIAYLTYAAVLAALGFALLVR